MDEIQQETFYLNQKSPSTEKEKMVVALLEEMEDEETGEIVYQPYQSPKLREKGKLPHFQPWIDIPAGLVKESDLDE